MTKFVALVSGKGGVGKTTTTINLGHALTELDKKTVIMDANLETPNLALHLGLINPKASLNKFLRGEKNIKEVTYQHESGLSLVPASPSFEEYQKTNIQKITEAFEHLDESADVVLVDSPSGLGLEVEEVLKNTDEALIIVNPTLSSVMDALKTIRVAHTHGNTIAGVILNMTHGGRHELKRDEIEKIVGHPILGNIKRDNKIRKAQHKGMPAHALYPYSRNAREYRRIAQYVSLDKGLALK